jgi:hypothetical protein
MEMRSRLATIIFVNLDWILGIISVVAGGKN